MEFYILLDKALEALQLLTLKGSLVTTHNFFSPRHLPGLR